MKHGLRTPAPQSLLRVLLAPALLAAASIAGVLIGLAGDGWCDLLSSALLFLPVAVFLRHWRQRG